MKTPEEIKKSFRVHSLNKRSGCIGCAYRDPNKISFKCQGELFKDLRVYIKQLEAERDALLRYVKGQCHACEFCDCSFTEEPCCSCFADHRSKWHWRGVQKEE